MPFTESASGPPTGGLLTGKPEKSEAPQLKSALSQVWALVRSHRLLLGIGVLLLLVNRVAGLVVPYTSKLLLDRVIGKRDLSFLAVLAGMMISATIVQAGTTFLLSRLMSRAGQKVITELRRKIQAHISRLPVSYYDANKTGELVSRVMTDVEGVRNLIGSGSVELMGGVLTAVLAMILMARLSLLLTVIAVVFWVAYSLVLKRTFEVIRPIFRERVKINAEIAGRLTESFSGVRVVKGYRAEAREQENFSLSIERLFQSALRAIKSLSFMATASVLNAGTLGAVIMVVGAIQIFVHKMTAGDLFSYIMIMAYVAAPLEQITNVGTQITEALAGLDRTREVLSERPEDDDPNRTIVLPGIRGHVRFDHVHFAYEAGSPVLEDISFESPPGSVTALVGSSGSGKSTIIGLVAAFYKPTIGHVLIDGVDLNRIRLDCYRPALGIVLQESFLFDGTIRENVAFSRQDATETQIMNACRVAHVDEFVERFKDKYDTVIGERGVKLSGGQRQRVSIARAILADPRILILDEATSSLDSESEAFIQQGLKCLMKGCTTFVIAHRLSTICQADSILVIEAGRIFERGTHQSLYAQKGRYFDLYNKQHELESNLLRDPQPEAHTDPQKQSGANRSAEQVLDPAGFNL